MAAGRYDRLVVEQGSSFDLQILVPYDLTGALVSSKARLSYNDTSALIDFEVSVTAATSGNSRIALHADADAITAHDFGASGEDYVPGVWDLDIELAPTGESASFRVLEGRCKFKRWASK